MYEVSSSEIKSWIYSLNRMGLHCHFLVDSLSVMNHCLHLDKSPRSFSSESVREKVPDGNTALNHLRGECQAVYFPSGWGPSCKLYCPDSSQAGSWGWGRQVFPSLPGSGHTREQGPLGDVTRPCHEGDDSNNVWHQAVPRVCMISCTVHQDCTLSTLTTIAPSAPGHPTWTLFMCKVSTWPSVEQAKTAALCTYLHLPTTDNKCL